MIAAATSVTCWWCDAEVWTLCAASSCSFTARSSNRDEDQIEKTDTALAAVAVELLEKDSDAVCVVTTDTDAGEGVVAALEANGFENRAQFRDGFELIEEIS